ncbi:hypothetical protein P8452_53434 [Trifolium repens]|nr:hypothetical protein P8452_53434 [Trifolium repens]
MKKLAGKKTRNSSKKSNSVQTQEEGLCLSRVHETENAGFSTSQTIDEIDTQESIQTNIAPFNPNQNIFVEVNQVPYYSQSQIIKHNISYAELLEAQHHMNDKPSSRGHERTTNWGDES